MDENGCFNSKNTPGNSPFQGVRNTDRPDCAAHEYCKSVDGRNYLSRTNWLLRLSLPIVDTGP